MRQNARNACTWIALVFSGVLLLAIDGAAALAQETPAYELALVDPTVTLAHLLAHSP